MFNSTKTTAGFSLLEFLAVMVLVAVLALISMPIYDSYIKKARFQNVIQAVDSFKPAVAACAQSTGSTDPTLEGCVNGSNGIPEVLTATGYIAGVTVEAGGIITGTATNAGGLDGKTYILKPTLQNGFLIWTMDTTGSTCLEKALCDNPV
ncbi:MAG: hypothetical protein A3F12_02005 [Gammaproteobacteria bacterium RIFCSPHIGHO2_12_FULL_38_14]|nr:MAG: hypothetical protein A3F12_02005 [Gammaproteobacteria bacterium RIFCSPHIGHO2_12_FULL_38_14]